MRLLSAALLLLLLALCAARVDGECPGGPVPSGGTHPPPASRRGTRGLWWGRRAVAGQETSRFN